MKYNSHLNYKKRKRFLLKVRIFLVLVLITLLAGGVMFYLKYVRESNPNTPDKTTSEVTTSTIAPSINIFRSPFFQFQAPDSWVEVTNESTSNKFVYRSLRNNLIEHELNIYVNQVPANLEANRVVPVTFTNNNSELVAEQVSEHCIKSNNNQSTINRLELIVSTVRMFCDSDSTNYTVFAGQKNDDTVLNMIRPNGTLESYTLYYVNLKANPDAAEFVQIINTFQTR